MVQVGHKIDFVTVARNQKYVVFECKDFQVSNNYVYELKVHTKYI